MTTKKDVLKAIRKKCLGCCSGSYSMVRNCQDEGCGLFPFRFGYDPSPKIKGFAKTHRTCGEFCMNETEVMVNYV